jgi:hypothetical protein
MAAGLTVGDFCSAEIHQSLFTNLQATALRPSEPQLGDKGQVKHHHAPGGLFERIFLGLELLWIVVAAIAGRSPMRE